MTNITTNSRRDFLKGGALLGAAAAATVVTAATGAQATTTAAPAITTPHLDADMVTAAERAANDKRVLVVVDYQVDFVNGSLGNDNAQAIEPAVVARIKAAIEAGDLIYYTMDTHPADTYELTREGKRVKAHCVPGTPGWELYGGARELLQNSGATMVKKSTYGSVELPKLIDFAIHQGANVTEIELIGVATTACVINNAVILLNHFPEVALKVSRSATASKAMEAQNVVLDQLGRFGIEIVD